MMLFYNARSRAGATAQIDDGGVLRERHAADDLGLWTHLVSDGRFILFYNADMRTGATARIDDGGVLRDERDVSQVALGLWTHLVAYVQARSGSERD
jgi:hypothetical protein